MKLFLKGERCYSPKCSVEKRTYAPGMHGKKGTFKHKESDFALQLREKQKARRFYGVQERQFRRYFSSAQRVKGMTGVNLLQTLERRLDNVVYRLGLADSRPQARQLVRHGHFSLNGHNHNVPSYWARLAMSSPCVKAAITAATSRRADRLGRRAVRNGCSLMNPPGRPSL
jgi:small subunit ribosomal protein S4